MSAFPETRIVCDRCAAVTVVPLNNGPVDQRYGPPDDWLTLPIRSEPPRHLCYECMLAFAQFMAGQAIARLEPRSEV